MPAPEPDHYATLGLDRDCSELHIRSAYRLLAKQYHPDVNGGSDAAKAMTQALNAAYEILSDPIRRKAYDSQHDALQPGSARFAGARRNVAQEMQLRIEEFLRGTVLQVQVIEPADGAESYELVIPPETAPGTRFRIPRRNGGSVTVKVKVRPDLRFKVRGSDLRCDLQINFERARKGGSESVRGVSGNYLRVNIPALVKSGEVIRIAAEGLPRARGGRGDLLVRVTYRPEVRIKRVARGRA